MRTFILLSAVVCALIGCEDGKHEEQLTRLPNPSVEETGGENVDFYLAFSLEGGDRGGLHQVLVVTSDEGAAISSRLTEKIVADENCANWTEYYVVDAATAKEIEKLVRDGGWVDAPSFLDVRLEDGYELALSGRFGRDSFRVEIDEPGDGILAFNTGKANSSEAGEPANALAELGILIRKIRAIAKANGEAFR